MLFILFCLKTTKRFHIPEIWRFFLHESCSVALVRPYNCFEFSKIVNFDKDLKTSKRFDPLSAVILMKIDFAGASCAQRSDFMLCTPILRSEVSI